MARTPVPEVVAARVRRAIAEARSHVGKKGRDPKVEEWIQYRRPRVYAEWIGYTERLDARLAFIAEERRRTGWPSPWSEQRSQSNSRRLEGEFSALRELTGRRYDELDPALGPHLVVSAIPQAPGRGLADILAEDPGEPVAFGEGFRVLLRWLNDKPVFETVGPRARSEEAKQAVEESIRRVAAGLLFQARSIGRPAIGG